jgi:DNA repair protein RadC
MKHACPFCKPLGNNPDGSITRTEDILPYLDDFKALDQEHLVCFMLDSRMRVAKRQIITIGLLDAVMAHPREVYAAAIRDRAASIIVAHNHPSGDPSPSRRDIGLTQQLAAAGQLLGVALWDHVIVTKSDYFSFKRHELL